MVKVNIFFLIRAFTKYQANSGDCLTIWHNNFQSEFDHWLDYQIEIDDIIPGGIMEPNIFYFKDAQVFERFNR